MIGDQEDMGVARSSAGRSAALQAEPVPVSGLRPAATNAGLLGFLAGISDSQFAGLATSDDGEELLSRIVGVLANAADALEPFAQFIRAYDAKPLRLDDEFYAIHSGTDWEASVRLSDMRRAGDALASIQGAPAQGIETEGEDPKGLRAEHESPVGEADAPKGSGNA